MTRADSPWGGEVDVELEAQRQERIERLLERGKVVDRAAAYAALVIITAVALLLGS